jgi:hypothetical protein
MCFVRNSHVLFYHPIQSIRTFITCSHSLHHIYHIALNHSLIRKTKKPVLAHDDMIQHADVEILRSLTNLGR